MYGRRDCLYVLSTIFTGWHLFRTRRRFSDRNIRQLPVSIIFRCDLLVFLETEGNVHLVFLLRRVLDDGPAEDEFAFATVEKSIEKRLRDERFRGKL